MSRSRAALRLLIGAALAMPASAQTAGPIDGARMSATVKVLASDAFEGRAPGTAGEHKTVAYLIARFKALGLEPAGDGGGWTQAVPLVHTRLAPGVTVRAGGAVLAQGRDVYVTTARPAKTLAIAGAPMVFVGHGVSAPERGWDDYKGVDLRGKIAVFLVNDPDFAATAGEPVAGRFGGTAMTYYGRWTYKYEEAARRGALGALIVHDTPGAGYGWSTVIAPGGEVYDVVRPAGQERVAMQGWIEGEAARALFRRAGQDLDALRTAARRADFRPVPLTGVDLSVTGAVSVERVESRNVLAKIIGAKRPGEAVMYGAHWDAYGIGAPDAQGRTVRPGALDDGIGLAAELEIARAFKAGPRPDRTVIFAAWTAEERGLLGSDSYAARPAVPLEKTVANLTIDILQAAGPARDVVQIGAGQTDLDRDLAAAAARQGRTVTPDAKPERGLFFRADHFPLVRRGVPAILMMGVGGGADLKTGARAAGDAWVQRYTDELYHKTGDTWSTE